MRRGRRRLQRDGGGGGGGGYKIEDMNALAG